MKNNKGKMKRNISFLLASLMLCILKPAKDRLWIRRPEEHVSHNEYCVIRMNLAVPIGDQRLVHLLHRRKGAVAETDNVCMIKMRICGKVDHLYHLQF